MTTAGGSRLTTSVGGTLTGRGGDVIIIDDPLKPQDAHSESARESQKQWLTGTLLSRLDHKSEGSIIVVMQRLDPDDLVGHLIEQGGWEHLNLPRSPRPTAGFRSATIVITTAASTICCIRNKKTKLLSMN